MSLEGVFVKEEDLIEACEGGNVMETDTTDIYVGHEIKEDLVIGPTMLHPPDSKLMLIPLSPEPPPHVEKDPAETHVPVTHSMDLHFTYAILGTKTTLHTCQICYKKFISKNKLTCHIKLHSCDISTNRNISQRKSACRIKLHKRKKPCDECTSEGAGACVQDIKNRSLPNQVLIEKGRSKPDLKIVVHNKKFYTRTYEVYPWLTGCVHKNRLFCYYCLLFSSCSSVWASTGFYDIRNLHKGARKHAQSAPHIEASVKFLTLGKNRIETSLNSESRIEIATYNAKADRNINIFKRLIDIVCFSGKELSCSADIYSELVEFLAKYDAVLESHLQNSSSFSIVSSQVQTDLIASVASALDDHIKQQISGADFVAVMLEEAADVDGERKLAIVLRYFHESRVCERFIKYVDVRSDHSPEAIRDIILQTLSDYNCLSKLTAQTYDGAAALCRDLGSVAALVRQQCPFAVYVWCSAHQLNLVLSKSCERVPETKRFFAIIKNLADFFHNSTKRQNHYNKMADLKQLLRVPAADWAFGARIVSVIFNACPCLIDLFEDISKNEDTWDGDTLRQASSFMLNLKDFEFQFFLHVFNKIFTETDALYETVQNNSAVVDYSRIEEIIKKLEDLRDMFEKIFEDVEKIAGATRKQNDGDVKDDFKRIFHAILDNVSYQCSGRYQSLEDLEFFQLLSCELMARLYQSTFPLEEINRFGIAYKSFKFNVGRLRNELRCVYKTAEFRNRNVYDLIEHFHGSGLNAIFPESIRLAKLIGTFPATSFMEGSSSCLRRRAHLTTPRRRLTDLSKIYIETTLLNELRLQRDFYDAVIKIYSEKDSRIELIYKR